jgi:hypothetical protein
VNTEPPAQTNEPSTPEVIDLDSDDWLRIADGMEMGGVCELLWREGEWR